MSVNDNRALDRLFKTVGALAPYACKAGIKDGIARCRNLVPCSVASHDGEDALMAPRPDVVLVKVNLNKRWGQRLAQAGIPVLERSQGRAQELAQEREHRAEQLGRSAFAIRKKGRGGNPETPEDRDTGCPVFGKQGLTEGVQGSSIPKVTWQLRDSGFRLVAAHRLQRGWKPPIRLVMVFERTPGTDIRFPWQLFRELTDTCFMQIDIWANDRDDRGNVVHTINCGKRDDTAKVAYALRFAKGDWEVVESR